MQPCNNSQMLCSNGESLKEMMNDMSSFIKTSTDLVQTLNDQLEGTKSENKPKAIKNSKGKLYYLFINRCTYIGF